MGSLMLILADLAQCALAARHSNTRVVGFSSFSIPVTSSQSLLLLTTEHITTMDITATNTMCLLIQGSEDLS